MYCLSHFVACNVNENIEQWTKIKCAVNTEHETEMNEQIHFYRLWYTQSYTKLYIMYVIYILRSKIIDKFYL